MIVHISQAKPLQGQNMVLHDYTQAYNRWPQNTRKQIDTCKSTMVGTKTTNILLQITLVVERCACA